MSKILAELSRIAKNHYEQNGGDQYVVRGLWKNQYILQLTPNESVFNLKYLLVQTDKQGCCYVDEYNNGIDESILGQNLLTSPISNVSVMTAYLDAVFSSIIRNPDDTFKIEGSNIEKAPIRAKIVCNEVFALLKGRKPKNGGKLSVLNVGVVGGFLQNFTSNNAIEVKACDLYSKVIGKVVHGVKVENGTKQGSTIIGDRTIELIIESDLALVTGMTLATHTLDEIISTAKKNDTALVIFAETGANFAEEYCKMGADVVVSEPHPFYMICNGSTQINIYRK